MTQFAYKKVHLDYLRKYYPKLFLKDLAVKFNARFGTDKTASALKSACKNRKILCGRIGKHFKAEEMKATEEQFQFVADCYQQYSLFGMTRAFNKLFPRDWKTPSQMQKFVKANETQLAGLRTGIKIQNVKANSEWRDNPSHFKSGNKPKTEKPIGSEKVSPANAGLVIVKVAEVDPSTGAPTRWKPKHFIVWEAHHGPIPQGMCLTFRDCNKLNNAIENLELISKKLMMRLNLAGYWTAPPELRPSLRAIAELKARLSDVKASQGPSTKLEPGVIHQRRPRYEYDSAI